MRYEIVTNQGSLDVLYDYDIALNYSINDILDLGKTKTSYSKTIILPGTPINNKFFKQIFDVNVDNISFNPKKKISAIIKVGGNDLLDGYLQLLNININNRDIEYEVNIVGKLSNLFNNIGDLTLNSVDLSEYNHYRTKENIINSWEHRIFKNDNLITTEPGDGYVYSYIVRGNNQDIESKMYSDETYPSIYYKTIIDKIINGAGYSYTSNFLNSNYFKKIILPFSADKIQITQEESDLLETRVGVKSTITGVAVTPPVQKGYGWFYTSTKGYFFPFERESGTVTNSGQDLIFRDDSNQWEVAPNLSKWTCSKSGRYNFNLMCKAFPSVTLASSTSRNIEFDSGSFQYRYQMLLLKANGQTIELDSSKDGSNGQYGVYEFGLGTGGHLVGGGNIWVDYTTPLTLDMNANDVYCEQGDRVVIRIGLNHPDSIRWKTSILYPLQPKGVGIAILVNGSYGDPSSTDAYSRFEIVKSNNTIDPEGLINMNNVLDGSIKQRDLLLDAVKMFNLVISDNPLKDGDLLIEPYDDFYTSKQKVLDWDEERRLDNDSLVKITPMSDMEYKTYNWTYTDDTDFYNNEYKADTNGLLYGTYTEQVINELSDGTSEIKVSFSPTPNATADIDDRIAPFFVDYSNEEYSPKSVKQRVLFYNGLVPCNNYKLYTTKEDLSPTSLNSYPQCGMWDSYTSPLNSLEFGRGSVNYFTSPLFPNQTLFERFHKTTLQQIKDLNSKLMEVTVRWTPSDMAQFDFRDIVFLNGSYWRVNEIKDYNPINSDKLTTFILYKIIDINILNKFQVEVPTSNSSCPTDVTTKKINWNSAYYISASGQLISSECCSQLGGNFINGVCKVINTFPGAGVGGDPWAGGDPWFEGSGLRPWGGGRPYTWAEPWQNPIVGGPWVIPFDRPYPLTFEMYGTTRYKNNRTQGEGNLIQKTTRNNNIWGDYSSVSRWTKNTLVVGSGIVAKEDNSITLKNAIIKSDGTIHRTGVHIIDGGLDVVFPFNKTNPIEIVDGTIDSVRNIGGDSWSRPIIDGNPYE